MTTIAATLVVFAVFASNFGGIHSHLTSEEIANIIQVTTKTCQQKHDIPDNLADGIKTLEFPKSGDFNCFQHCLLTHMNILRKGKLKADLAIRQIKLLMPPELRDILINSIQLCKDVGNSIEEECERSATTFQCLANTGGLSML